ncbi:hypothetical protein FB567DRAFT_586027 [Paraphoma chrysanthemicola]|uniref:Uncharacterized protein n=1 Tax=Paraphoma chrysanthemicola TaxID=798071 RepID=A0A8K0RHM6_9PLEO|nr:hypothetical protein FB567DRAFT_586027 [Paraphoma chrysanthemicola]
MAYADDVFATPVQMPNPSFYNKYDRPEQVKCQESIKCKSAIRKGAAFTDILIVAFAIVVVAASEGLLLAVNVALAFATTKMLKENNPVRVIRACETMGNAIGICSDKTGTLVCSHARRVGRPIINDVPVVDRAVERYDNDPKSLHWRSFGGE